MARIKKIEISHFRGIKYFEWMPNPGVNCLVGPGDSGKSTILDAIDLCLGARKYFQFNDGDFYKLEVDTPIRIAVTIGDLEDSLKNFDAYGLYLRSFNPKTGEEFNEPEAGMELVLKIVLTVNNDLEPSWKLFSERAEALNQSRNLVWTDRIRISPTKLGDTANYHLSWRRGSILNRVSEERANVSRSLANAAREVRTTFGNTAKEQVAETLAIVQKAALELGIPVNEVTAMLDARSVSFAEGVISLHDDGVPLAGLGLGSTRLLIAALQRRAANHASIVLVDEVEHGLEPHRIMRLIGSLGAKESPPPLQVFMTTHSPVALRELSVNQLYVLRCRIERHDARLVGNTDEMQGTVRSCPEAFLAKSVMVCEGASEIGFIRGLDQFRVTQGLPSASSLGVASADGNGHNMYNRAMVFAKFGYNTLLFRDNDDHHDPDKEVAFQELGGTVIAWHEGKALEEELFDSLSEKGVLALIEIATDILNERPIDDHIKSASNGKLNLDYCRNNITPEVRHILGKAAKSGKGWFKKVYMMERVANEVVGPGLETADEGFCQIIEKLFNWAKNVEA